MYKPSRRNHRPESLVNRQVVAILRRLPDAYWFRNNVMAGYLVRPNGSRQFIATGKKGAPDYILLWRGKWIGIECKAGYNDQQPVQKQAQAEIEAAGGYYLMVRSGNELEFHLEDITGQIALL